MTQATLADALAFCRRQLMAAGSTQAGLEARLLVAHAAGVSASHLIGHGSDPLESRAAGRLEEMLQRRLAREPLAYILGEKEFWSLRFEVNASTLIPRPESETLIEAALAWLPDRRWVRILDLGTGSGCLLLALLSELPLSWGLGIDASWPALALARANADALGLGDRACFLQADWTAPLDGRFDVIVANPPYIAAADWPQLSPEIARYEPRAALDGGIDGLDAYRRIVPALAGLLRRGGAAFLEIGDGQAAAVAALARAAGFQHIEVTPDLAGVARSLQLLADATPAGKKSLGNQMVPI